MVQKLFERSKRVVTSGQRGTLIALTLMSTLVFLLGLFPIVRLVLYPFALVSTVFHEFGHALMCWLTGGSVHGIVINPDESGLTRFVGGSACLTLPAGYLGSTFIGSLLVFAGFSEQVSRWAFYAVSGILLATLWFSEHWYTALIALILIGAMTGAWLYKEGRLVRWFILLMGVTASMSSLSNILSTAIFHHVPGSDAVEFARQCSFILPFFVFGLIWLAASLGGLIAAVMLALRFFPEPQ